MKHHTSSLKLDHNYHQHLWKRVIIIISFEDELLLFIELEKLERYMLVLGNDCGRVVIGFTAGMACLGDVFGTEKKIRVRAICTYFNNFMYYFPLTKCDLRRTYIILSISENVEHLFRSSIVETKALATYIVGRQPVTSLPESLSRIGGKHILWVDLEIWTGRGGSSPAARMDGMRGWAQDSLGSHGRPEEGTCCCGRIREYGWVIGTIQSFRKRLGVVEQVGAMKSKDKLRNWSRY